MNAEKWEGLKCRLGGQAVDPFALGAVQALEEGVLRLCTYAREN